MATFLRRLFLVALGLTSLSAASACHKLESIATPVKVTQEFSGTVAKGGFSDKTFRVDYDLALTDGTVTLKSLTSTATGAALNITIGVAFGGLTSSTDSTCIKHPLGTNPAQKVGEARVASQFFGNGDYCVSVYDAGTLTESVNYVISVDHY